MQATSASVIGPDPEMLGGLLESIAECEMQFSEHFYSTFFAGRPDARKLFGRYAIAEQEEMIRETFRSIHALLNGDDWLEGNLAALGRSHLEYGVTDDMYVPFIDAMLECARSLLGDEMSALQAQQLRSSLGLITDVMRQAAREAEKPSPHPTNMSSA